MSQIGEDVGGKGDMTPHLNISEPNKVHKFYFQASGILIFIDVQKLCGPKYFTIFTVNAIIFGRFMMAFHFF